MTARDMEVEAKCLFFGFIAFKRNDVGLCKTKHEYSL